MAKSYKHLMRRALIALGAMFGLLFAALTAIVWYLQLPLTAGIVTAVVIAGLQYIFSPFIIRLLLSIQFDVGDPQKIFRPGVFEFIQKVCKENKMPVPKIGTIYDGNPNAFVFGHFKWDARLVVTSGLLDILDEDEQKAVIAHELGHIRNNDFILMTIVSLIPLIMYQIYAWTRRGNRDNLVGWIGLGAYAAYILSQFLVLAFSRIREYYADNFSKRIMGSGEPLKNALIKIAYGFTRYKEEEKRLKASTIGIANAAQSEAFFLLNYRDDSHQSEIDKKLISWDINNVWGKWYEFNSTHPLTAKRIIALSEENIYIGRPGVKQYLHFLFEVFVKLLPWITAAAIVLPGMERIKISSVFWSAWNAVWNQPLFLVVLGVSILISYYYSYGRNFTNQTVESLLLREDASPVKGIPAVLEGKIIGKGIPGLFWSEDIVINDGTGIILVDYRQPLRILEFLFGILKVDDLTMRDARVVGWYMRGMAPYFVCKHIIVEDRKYRSYVYILTKLFGYAVTLTGCVLFILKLFYII